MEFGQRQSAVWSRLWELNARTEIDTSVVRYEYIMNHAVDEHRRTPLCTRCAWDTRAHYRTRFDIIWTTEFAETEAACHVADNILSSPGVREMKSLKSAGAIGQTVAGVNTDQIVERDGGASCQLDQNQLQSVKVSLDRDVTTNATMQRVGTQLTTNNVESGIGGLRIVAGHQVEQADSMLPIEAMKSSANTIAGVSRQYEHYTGKLRDRDTSALQSISVRSDREKKLRPLMELMSVWQRSHLKCRL